MHQTNVVHPLYELAMSYIVSHVKGMVFDVGCAVGDWRMGWAALLSSLHKQIRKRTSLKQYTM